MDDHVGENEVGEARGTFVGDKNTVFCWGNPKGRNYLTHQGIDGSIILNRIVKKEDKKVRTGSICVVGSNEHGCELSGCIQTTGIT